MLLALHPLYTGIPLATSSIPLIANKFQIIHQKADVEASLACRGALWRWMEMATRANVIKMTTFY